MKFGKYLIDHLPETMIAGICFVSAVIILASAKASRGLLLMLAVLFAVGLAGVITAGYFRRRRFYQELTDNVRNLDQKYLVLETIGEPSFYEGQILYQNLYEIDKSMTENVNLYRRSMEDFKEYIELWVHEVKLPIASLLLMCHNNPNISDAKFEEQLRRMDNYTEQVLYYARSEQAHKDYLIKTVSLKEIVHSVLMKNKDDLLLRKMEITVEPMEVQVTTDEKWMEFILGQLLVNSMKYAKKDEAHQIRIFAEKEEKRVVLHIWDNGVGIPQRDVGRIFEKSFTGENGRKFGKSTGMGLYIVKKLCDQLGHGVQAESEQGVYTDVCIFFTRMIL